MSDTGPSVESSMTGDSADESVVFNSDADEAGIRNPKILRLPVRMVVSVGGAQLTVQEIMDLTPASIIDLDSKIHDPASIYVGDRLIARGELVEIDGEENGLGIRLTEICAVAE